MGDGRGRRRPNGSEHAAAAPSTADIDGLAITTEAINLARTTGDPLLLLEALTIGSLHLAAVGSLPDVLHDMNDEAGALAEAVGDPWHIAMVVALRGMASYVAGELESSMKLLRAAIDNFRELDDQTTAGLFEISFSEVAELRGDIAEATAAMARPSQSTPNRVPVVDDAAGRALLVDAAATVSAQRALELGREVVALAHQPFNPVVRAQALFALGVAETLAELPDAAAEHLGEA